MAGNSYPCDGQHPSIHPRRLLPGRIVLSAQLQSLRSACTRSSPEKRGNRPPQEGAISESPCLCGEHGTRGRTPHGLTISSAVRNASAADIAGGKRPLLEDAATGSRGRFQRKIQRKEKPQPPQAVSEVGNCLPVQPGMAMDVISRGGGAAGRAGRRLRAALRRVPGWLQDAPR